MHVECQHLSLYGGNQGDVPPPPHIPLKGAAFSVGMNPNFLLFPAQGGFCRPGQVAHGVVTIGTQ